LRRKLPSPSETFTKTYRVGLSRRLQQGHAGPGCGEPERRIWKDVHSAQKIIEALL
jgi:hypothetical protein